MPGRGEVTQDWSSEPDTGQWGGKQSLVLGSGVSLASECVVCLLWMLVAFWLKAKLKYLLFKFFVVF